MEGYTLKDFPITGILNQIAATIDISDENFKSAEKRYQNLSDWLSRKDSCLHKCLPSISVQGSFLLGTVVRPVSETDFYDVDLVCSLRVSQCSQRTLKEAVGREIQLYKEANGIKKNIIEGDYCWTLEYASDAHFSMDILPSVPDASIKMEHISTEISQHSIRLTYRKHNSYSQSIPFYEWKLSNPIGYGQWFVSRMKDIFDKIRSGIFTENMALYASVEDIPRYRIKTPLQRVVQLLKRHRSIVFLDNPEVAPSSIVITTLAAKAYNGEDNVLDALINVSEKMERYISQRNGMYYLLNPVNPQENFMDLWNENALLKEKFYMWLGKLQRDIKYIASRVSIDDSIEQMRTMFGSRVVTEVAKITTTNVPTYALIPAQRIIKAYGLSRFLEAHVEAIPDYESIPIEIKIKASYIDDDGREVPFQNDGLPIPKGKELKYYASSSKIHRPYEVFWQVVNTGADARYRGALRGGLFAQKAGWNGGTVLQEHSQYSGMHWVECFFKNRGSFIARSGRFVVNID
jgi:hypothetical protein